MKLDKIHLDGFEHYQIEHRREFDTEKVKRKLIDRSRGYVSFSETYDFADGKGTDESKIFTELADLFL
jgi:hypothetical protein